MGLHLRIFTLWRVLYVVLIRWFSKPVSRRLIGPRSTLLRAAVLGILLLLPVVAGAQMRMSPRLQRMLNPDQPGQGIQPGQGPQAQEPAPPSPPAVDGLDPWLKRFYELVPQSAQDFGQLDAAALSEASAAVEQWTVLWGRVAIGQMTEEQIGTIARLLEAKKSVDRQLDNVLSMRTQFASMPPDEKRHAALRGYLQGASTLISLSGRLRYALVDAIDDVADRMSDRPSTREHLIEMLTEKQSSVGAEVMAVELFNAPTPSPTVVGGPDTANSPGAGGTEFGRHAARAGTAPRRHGAHGSDDGGRSASTSPRNAGRSARAAKPIAKIEIDSFDCRFGIGGAD